VKNNGFIEGPLRWRLKPGRVRKSAVARGSTGCGEAGIRGLALIGGSLGLSSGKGMAQRVYPGVRRIGASA
jgi:hypothetical protein